MNSVISSLEDHITAVYDILEEKGVEISVDKNAENIANLIRAIS